MKYSENEFNKGLRYYKPKNPKNILSSVLKIGYMKTAERFGVSKSIPRKTIKRYYPKSYLKIRDIIRADGYKKSRNTFFFCEKYIYIVIKNKIAISNIKFSKKIIKYSWCLSGGYAQANIKNKRTTMHVYLYGKKNGLEIDHKNRNKLDNRIKNIRFVTRSFNVMNAVRKNKSGFRGVYDSKHNNLKNPWAARLEFNGKVYSLGYFKTRDEAYKARVKKEIEMFGSEVLL